jgi:hypothetical protein
VQSIGPGRNPDANHASAPDPAAAWIVETDIPGGGSSPDPDAPPRSIQDQSSAESFAARLSAAGFPSEAQRVQRPKTADVPAGLLGYRVRLRTTFSTEAAASAEVARLSAAGFSGRAWYSGWDGDSTARGPWTVNIVTVNPKRFRGTLRGTYGPSLEDRKRPHSSRPSCARRLLSTAGSSCSILRPAPRATLREPASTGAAWSPSRSATGPCSCYTAALATPASCDPRGPGRCDCLREPAS